MKNIGNHIDHRYCHATFLFFFRPVFLEKMYCLDTQFRRSILLTVQLISLIFERPSCAKSHLSLSLLVNIASIKHVNDKKTMLGKHCSGRDNNFALTNLHCKSLFFDIYKATNPTTMNEVIALLLVYLMNFCDKFSQQRVHSDKRM